MAEILKVLFVFLFAFYVALAESSECGDGLDKKTKDLILEQGKVTRELLKAEMDGYFRRLEESFNQKLLASNSKILSGLQILGEKVDVNQNKLTQMDKLIVNVSEVLNQNLKEFQSKAPISTVLTNETAQELTSKNRTRVIVDEVVEDSGTIEFDGGANSDVLRKVWMLQRYERTFISDARFVMEENQLGQYAHLTIWSSSGHHHLYNGSQEDWMTERRARGDLILVTLTMRPSHSADDHPHFKLRFNVTRDKSFLTSYSSEVMRADGGVETLSYPKENTQNYSSNSLFQAVIAPSTGRLFALTLNYLDVFEETGSCRGALYVTLIKENPTDAQYEQLPSSAVRACGQPGNISELIGHSTVAIVQFYSDWSEKTGRGFRIAADISGNTE